MSSASSLQLSSESPTLHITEPDMDRLRTMLDRYLEGGQAHTAELLELELDRAVVVPQKKIPPTVVTMRARVVVEDMQTGRQRELVLVYPNEADASASKVSVMTPVGAAVLGLSVGDSIDWPFPDGRTVRLKVVAIPYQPEAAGDLHL